MNCLASVTGPGFGPAHGQETVALQLGTMSPHGYSSNPSSALVTNSVPLLVDPGTPHGVQHAGGFGVGRSLGSNGCLAGSPFSSEPPAASDLEAISPSGKGTSPSAKSSKGKGKAPPVPPKAKAAKGKGKSRAKSPPPPKASAEAEAAKAKSNCPAVPKNKALPKTKPLSWQKLSGTSEGTVWAMNRERTDDIELERARLEELFAYLAPSAVPKVVEGGSAGENVCLTSSERSMGIAIGMRCVHNLSLQAMRDAILMLDPKVLTMEVTERLLACDAKTQAPTVLPTAEETAAAQAHIASGMSQAGLDDASKFIIAVHDVPQLRDRLKFHQLRLGFEANVAEMSAALAAIRLALHEVRNSGLLAEILMLVLKAGNVLNDGTERGDASGFRMDSLPALMVLRGQAGSSSAAESSQNEAPKKGTGHGHVSFIDYLVGVIIVQRPALLMLGEELGSLSKASRTELEEVVRDAAALREELGRLERSLSLNAVMHCSDVHAGLRRGSSKTLVGNLGAEESSPSVVVASEDSWLAGAWEFILHAGQQLNEIDKDAQEVSCAYAELVAFFGVDPKAASGHVPVHEWLGFIHNFVLELQKAESHYQKRAEREKHRATVQARKARKKQSLSMRTQRRMTRLASAKLKALWILGGHHGDGGSGISNRRRRTRRIQPDARHSKRHTMHQQDSTRSASSTQSCATARSRATVTSRADKADDDDDKKESYSRNRCASSPDDDGPNDGGAATSEGGRRCSAKAVLKVAFKKGLLRKLRRCTVWTSATEDQNIDVQRPRRDDKVSFAKAEEVCGKEDHSTPSAAPLSLQRGSPTVTRDSDSRKVKGSMKRRSERKGVSDESSEEAEQLHAGSCPIYCSEPGLQIEVDAEEKRWSIREELVAKAPGMVAAGLVSVPPRWQSKETAAGEGAGNGGGGAGAAKDVVSSPPTKVAVQRETLDENGSPASPEDAEMQLHDYRSTLGEVQDELAWIMEGLGSALTKSSKKEAAAAAAAALGVSGGRPQPSQRAGTNTATRRQWTGTPKRHSELDQLLTEVSDLGEELRWSGQDRTDPK